MKFQLVVIFVTISSTFSAPTPQGFDLNSFNFQFFDEDNVAQGRLPPQGFQPHREVSVRQAEPAAVPNGAEVVRQFYDLDDLHYKYTWVEVILRVMKDHGSACELFSEISLWLFMAVIFMGFW